MKRTARDILAKKGGHLVTISSEATVYQALAVMTQNHVGSIVAVDDEKIVGIWTERDLMYQALSEGFDPKTSKLKDRMSDSLVSADADERVIQLYDKFLGKRIRHLLIRDKGEYIGILSVGDVMKASLKERTEELEKLNEMVSLEYYENWKELQAER